MEYEQTWDEEKRKAVIDILRDKIIDWGVTISMLPYDKTKDFTSYMPIVIDETMVGNTIEIEEYLIAQANEKDKYYLGFEPGNKYVWAFIHRIDDCGAEFYPSYEDVLQAANDLAEGKRPFNIISGPLKQRTCCYCKYSDGDKYITPDKKFYADPDAEFDCTYKAGNGSIRKVYPNDSVCEHFEPLDLDAALKEADHK